jgi:outer membrane biosynthesis protein TonB
MLPTNPLLNAIAPAGPHLPVALLRQYAAGTLAPAAQHRVEAHTLACTRCADILEGLLQTPATTTDQAVAQLQQRLRQRVQQVAPTRQPQRLAPRRPRWLSLQLAAAAALLLSMVAGGWWTWQQRHTQIPAVASAPSTLPEAAVAERVAPVPTPTPAASTDVPEMPAATHRSAPLARAATRRPHRHQPQPAGAAASTPPVAAVLSRPEPQPKAVAPAAVAAPAPPVTTSPAAAAPRDSLALSLTTPATKQLTNRSFATDPALVRDASMPAAKKIAPMPVGGMSSLREKLRREAAEFVPEAPEGRLSGTVQLRLTINAAGKLEGISVLRGLRADYDAEAQRLVCDEGPAWVPGISGGRRATLQIDVAVPF